MQIWCTRHHSCWELICSNSTQYCVSSRLSQVYYPMFTFKIKHLTETVYMIKKIKNDKLYIKNSNLVNKWSISQMLCRELLLLRTADTLKCCIRDSSTPHLVDIYISWNNRCPQMCLQCKNVLVMHTVTILCCHLCLWKAMEPNMTTELSW